MRGLAVIRPEVRALAQRWGETLVALAFCLAGLWLGLRGGGALAMMLGAGLALVAGGWAFLAAARVRFARPPEGPGLVEIREAELVYFGPGTGGQIGIEALQEIRLVTLRGRQVWWLRPHEGDPVLIPVDAAGNARLFDVFSTLPGLSQARLTQAMAAGAAGSAGGAGAGVAGGVVRALPSQQLVWRRPGRGVAPM